MRNFRTEQGVGSRSGHDTLCLGTPAFAGSPGSLFIMPPPPLLGYNNNVRHRGRIFHIQTEDSGVNSPRIMTHLFADGGRIVKSTRTDYSEHLEQEDMAVVVKNMMKEQHKAMFVALRSGELDDLIGFSEDLTKEAEPEEKAPLGTKKGSSAPPAPGEDKGAYAAPRSAGIFSVAPPSSHPGSIFGEVGLDEKSLDDAILSYLAEDETEGKR